jgi:hypothetical protein
MQPSHFLYIEVSYAKWKMNDEITRLEFETTAKNVKCQYFKSNSTFWGNLPMLLCFKCFILQDDPKVSIHKGNQHFLKNCKNIKEHREAFWWPHQEAVIRMQWILIGNMAQKSQTTLLPNLWLSAYINWWRCNCGGAGCICKESPKTHTKIACRMQCQQTEYHAHCAKPQNASAAAS